MGYTTEFKGRFEFDHKLSKAEADYINLFSRTRHMLRDPEKIKGIFKNWETENSFLGDLGPDAIYFVKDNFEEEKEITEALDPSKKLRFYQLYSDPRMPIKDYNDTPDRIPGLWCQWIVSDDHKHLEWDQGEKFYCYIDWLAFLIEHFFNKMDVKLNGTVLWEGEDRSDNGYIELKDSKIKIYTTTISSSGPRSITY